MFFLITYSARLKKIRNHDFSQDFLVYIYKNLAEIGHETSEKDLKSSVQKCTDFRGANRLAPRKWVQFCTEDFKSFLWYQHREKFKFSQFYCV